MAAQLYEAAEADLGDLDERIRNGDFAELHEWLAENVHRHGKRYETDDLVREATGEEFAAGAFTDYVTEKYGELYGLDSA
jgi:carboxypeptidase Taq